VPCGLGNLSTRARCAAGQTAREVGWGRAGPNVRDGTGRGQRLRMRLRRVGRGGGRAVGWGAVGPTRHGHAWAVASLRASCEGCRAEPARRCVGRSWAAEPRLPRQAAELAADRVVPSLQAIEPDDRYSAEDRGETGVGDSPGMVGRVGREGVLVGETWNRQRREQESESQWR
jgi:hypothetical protein